MRYSEKQYLDWAETLYTDADDFRDGDAQNTQASVFIQSRATLGLLAVELAREARRLIEEE